MMSLLLNLLNTAHVFLTLLDPVCSSIAGNIGFSTTSPVQHCRSLICPALTFWTCTPYTHVGCPPLYVRPATTKSMR